MANMEEKDKIKAGVKKMIRPLLIAAKGGVPLEKINREYREMIGEPIPYRKMGYSTLDEFLDQSPDLCRVGFTPNGVVLHAVATEATAHVAALVSHQRNTKKRAKPVKPPSRRPFTSARQWQPPTSSQSFRGNFNRNNQQGGNRPSRPGGSGRLPGGSGRFPTIQNRGPQALDQYQHQQQQRLRTPNYSNGPNGPSGPAAVNGMSRGGGRPQTRAPVTNQRTPFPFHPSNPQPNPYALYQAWNDPEVHQDILAILDNRLLPNPALSNSLLRLSGLSYEEKVELAKQPDLFRTLLHLSPERRIEYFRTHTRTPFPYHPSNPQPYSQSGFSLLDHAGNDPEVHQDILAILDEYLYLDLRDEEKVELAKQPDLFRTLLHLSPERRIEYFRNYELGRTHTNPELTNSLKDLCDEERIELAKQPNLYVTLPQVSPEKRVEYFRSHTRPPYQPSSAPQQPKPQPSAAKPSNNVNYVQQLTSYFDQNNMGEPTFKTAMMEMKVGTNNKMNNKGKKMTKWVSTVQVGEQRFQTFPNSFNSKEQAEEAAASLAIAKLDISASQANNNSVMAMPIGHFEDIQNEDAIESYVDRIFELVGNRTNGVWSTQIDVEYKRKYQKSLPDKWPSKIESSKEGSLKLRVDEPINGRYIIYPIINNEESEVVTNSGDSVVPVSSKTKPVNNSATETNESKNSNNLEPILKLQKSRPPKLKLPEDANWDVYITCVHSTMNVCLRILGDSYSNEFDAMVTEMELKYYESAEVPLDKSLLINQPEVGGLYAAKVEGDWHRVEVTHVHGLEVTCFFIDHGDEDVLKVQNLRALLPTFCVLAPQAKSVRLAGLEDLTADPTAQAELTNLVLGKSLVGQVHLKDNSGISMILYDTSNSEEDVNINEKVLEKFGQQTKKTNGVSSSPENPSTPPPPLEAPKESLSDSASDTSSTCSASGIKELMLLDLTKFEKVMPATIPEAGDFFDVNVTLAASPSNFTVQPWQNTTQLETFQSGLNAFYSKPQNAYGRTLTNADINSGDKFYAGQHMDGKWYRVKVNATIDENTVAAKIVDFGDFTMIPLENLQPLWPQFRRLPMQSVNASLADIVAANGDWTAEDTVWFSKRVVNCQFVSRIKDVIFDSLEENVRITLSLVDTTHPTTDIYIEKQLVEDKRAVYLCV